MTSDGRGFNAVISRRTGRLRSAMLRRRRVARVGAAGGIVAAIVAFGQTVGMGAAAADTTLTDCTQSALQIAIDNGGTIDDTCAEIDVSSPVDVPAGDTVTVVADPSVESSAQIYGGKVSQVFVVDGNLTLRLVRIGGGYVTGSPPQSGAATGSPARGGAILVSGSLTVQGSDVSGAAQGVDGVDATNVDQAGTGGGAAEGGAIYSTGLVRIEGATDSNGGFVESVINGTANGGYGGIGGYGQQFPSGGGVAEGSGGAGGAGGAAAGGAIYNQGTLYVTAAAIYGTAQGGAGGEGGGGGNGIGGANGSNATGAGASGGRGTHGASGYSGGTGGNGGGAEGGVIYNSGTAVFLASGPILSPAGVLIQGQAVGGSGACGGFGGGGGNGGPGGSGGAGLNSDSAGSPDGGPGGNGGSGGGGGSGGSGGKAGAGGVAQGGGVYDAGALYLGAVRNDTEAKTVPGGCNVDGENMSAGNAGVGGGGFSGPGGLGGSGGEGGKGGNGSDGGQGGFGGTGGSTGSSGNQGTGGAGGPGGDADGGFLYSTGTPTLANSTLSGSVTASSGSPGGGGPGSPSVGIQGARGGDGGSGGSSGTGDGGNGGAGGTGGPGGSGGNGANPGTGGAGGNADGGIIDAPAGLVLANDTLSGGQLTAGGGQPSISGGPGGSGGAGGSGGGGGTGGTGDTTGGYSNGLAGAPGGPGAPGGTGTTANIGRPGAQGNATNADVDGPELASPLSGSGSLPDATVGVPYDAFLTATGGTSPYSWAMPFGSLPAGLRLSSGGTVSGTPIQAGSFQFTVAVLDSASPAQLTVESLSLNVVPGNPPIATKSTLASSPNPAAVGQAVTYTATVSPPPDGGTVQFTDGGSPISGCGAQSVDPSSGRSTCTVSYPIPGSHTIAVAYSGDAHYDPSTAPPSTEQIEPSSSSSATSTGSSSSPATSSGHRGVTPQLRRVRSSGDTLDVTVSCTGARGTTCTVTLTLTITETIKHGRVIAVTAAKGRWKIAKRTVILAEVEDAIAAGQTKTIQLTLKAAGKRLLAKRHRLNIEFTLRESGKMVSHKAITFTTRQTHTRRKR